MPRRNRIHYRNAFYHVMLRGNNRKNIFLKKNDYQLFIEILANAADLYNFKVHLYCLMTNHIHIVIEVSDIPISRIMQTVSSRYAKTHNEKYNKIGHLFQGRFKSKLIASDHYLIELCYYIHMNPIKAKICKLLDEYSWSSHHVYKERKNSNWMMTDYICKIISNYYETEMGYKKFIASYAAGNVRPSICKFNDDGGLDIQNDVGSRLQNRPSLALENISLTIIAKVVCKQFQVSLESIVSDSQARRVTLARSMIAYFGHFHAKYTFVDISAIVCRQPNSIGKTLSRHLKLAAFSREVSNEIISIERELSISDVDGWIK